MKLKDKTPISYITASQEASLLAAAKRAKEQFELEEDRKELLAEAARVGVSIVHVFNPNYFQGGLTVAFRKVSPFTSGRMVEVAVASCSPEDTFSKKVGTRLALQAYFDGETIKLPLLWGYEDEDVNGAVKRAFTNLLDSKNE